MWRLAAMAALLAGCATPYQARGIRGGYKDFEVRPGVYSISVRGNGYTGRATLTEQWHRRARELCHGDYDFQSDTQTDTTIMVNSGAPQMVNRHEVTGYATCRK